jgi:hypothetical protein
MSVTVTKVDDKYMVVATRPHVTLDWKSDHPMDAESVVRKMHQLGSNARDMMDLIAYADQWGEGGLLRRDHGVPRPAHQH